MAPGPGPGRAHLRTPLAGDVLRADLEIDCLAVSKLARTKRFDGDLPICGLAGFGCSWSSVRALPTAFARRKAPHRSPVEASAAHQMSIVVSSRQGKPPPCPDGTAIV